MRSIALGLLLVLGLVIWRPSSAQIASRSSDIVDVSWPNCKATPPKDNALGIVGVTGGLNYRENPCLKEEARWFHQVALYINTGYPGIEYARKYNGSPLSCRTNDEACLAYDYGYNAAKYAADYAFSQGIYTRSWWLDVETVNSWSDTTSYNRMALTGMIDGLKSATFVPQIGFYSHPRQWRIITTDWRNNLPVWIATGSLKRQEAIAACRQKGFTGGQVWLAQYTEGLDKNIICNPSVLIAPFVYKP